MPLSRRLPPGLAGRIGGSVSGICRRRHIVMEDRRANCPTGQSARASCTAPRRYEPHYGQLPASVKGWNAWQSWVPAAGAIFQPPPSFWNAAWVWYSLRPANSPTITT